MENGWIWLNPKNINLTLFCNYPNFRWTLYKFVGLINVFIIQSDTCVFVEIRTTFTQQIMFFFKIGETGKCYEIISLCSQEGSKQKQRALHSRRVSNLLDSFLCLHDNLQGRRILKTGNQGIQNDFFSVCLPPRLCTSLLESATPFGLVKGHSVPNSVWHHG